MSSAIILSREGKGTSSGKLIRTARCRFHPIPDLNALTVVFHNGNHGISLLAAGFFSKSHEDKRLVIANANGVGRVEKKAK